MTDRPIVDELNCRYWYMYSCSRHFPRLEALRLARTPRAGSQHSRRFFFVQVPYKAQAPEPNNNQTIESWTARSHTRLRAQPLNTDTRTPKSKLLSYCCCRCAQIDEPIGNRDRATL